MKLQPIIKFNDKWIKGEKEQPENEEQVLVIVNGKYGDISFSDAFFLASWFGDEGWVVEGFEMAKSLSVNYWMDLPDGPDK